jgi:predicted DNA-binding protein
MLGVRLSKDTEAALERHARAVGKPRSAVVRDWIHRGLQDDSADAQLRAAVIEAKRTDKPDDWVESDWDD